MSIYYIDENLKKRNTAGSKAPDDISIICENMGFCRIKMPMLMLDDVSLLKNIETTLKYLIFWIRFVIRIPKNSIIVYQHPTHWKRMSAKLLPWIIRLMRYRFIAIIHDLESLRGGISGSFQVNEKAYGKDEIKLLNTCSCVISHNEAMSDYLIRKGISEDIIINLGIFDYLCTVDKDRPVCNEKVSVCVAGNLAVGKSSYIYEMCNSNNENLRIHLYGNNYEERSNHSFIYHGSFKPEELPNVLEGRYGIVWDGLLASTCAGNTGEYLRFNNPHKTSLYLAAGIPVIVWNEAAIAHFIRINGVGICVSSLLELSNTINNIDEEYYLTMKHNAEVVGTKIRKGYYTEKAINRAIETVNSV